MSTARARIRTRARQYWMGRSATGAPVKLMGAPTMRHAILTEESHAPGHYPHMFMVTAADGSYLAYGYRCHESGMVERMLDYERTHGHGDVGSWSRVGGPCDACEANARAWMRYHA